MEKEKESWIKKLIELLNEYETPQSWVVFKSYDNYDGTFYWVDCDWETEIAWSDSYILGKRFWFIQWLVENEKIDFEKKLNTLRFESLVNQTLDSYLALLMLLSIQDEPISFILSILK